MIFLSDNDIIHKLAACDLLTDAWAALGLNLCDVYVLPTAKHKFGLTKTSDNAEKRYGIDILTRIRSFLSEAREIDFEVPAADLQLLAKVDGIDAGEAVLYAAAVQSQDYRLATGDKRSLRALASEVICRPIAERLSGRVVCLEQIVRESIQHCGFEHVKLKVLPALSCDTALRAAFGSGVNAAPTNVLQALDAYIAELRSLPVSLLVS
jgi:hypothetical protein